MSPHQANHSSSESINICITITGSMLAVMWHRFVCVCLVKKNRNKLVCKSFYSRRKVFQIVHSAPRTAHGCFPPVSRREICAKTIPYVLMYSPPLIPFSPSPFFKLLSINLLPLQPSHTEIQVARSGKPLRAFSLVLMRLFNGLLWAPERHP